MSIYAVALADLVALDGAIGAAVVDSTTGMVLARSIVTDIDLESSAAAITELVRAQGRALKMLGTSDSIDDILVTLTTQHHIIRPLRSTPELFLYIVLDRAHSHLPLARLKAQDVDAKLSV